MIFNEPVSWTQPPVSVFDADSCWTVLSSIQVIVIAADTELVEPATDSVNVVFCVVKNVLTGIAVRFDAVILGVSLRFVVGPTFHVRSHWPVAVLHTAVTDMSLVCANAAGASTAAAATTTSRPTATRSPKSFRTTKIPPFPL